MNVETYLPAEHDRVPNNARFPLLIYRHGLDQGEADDVAATFEAAFLTHGWPPRWRDGIDDYHHYQSTAHEALGIAAGSASLIIGGPDDLEISVEQGGALILPAGTGHCAMSASADFLVVRAYPYGEDWDICPGSTITGHAEAYDGLTGASFRSAVWQGRAAARSLAIRMNPLLSVAHHGRMLVADRIPPGRNDPIARKFCH